MPEPAGRWINRRKWQCPVCAAVNERPVKRCQKCDRSVSPAEDEPIRPLDPLDLIGPGRDADPGRQDDVTQPFRSLADDSADRRRPASGSSRSGPTVAVRGFVLRAPAARDHVRSEGQAGVGVADPGGQAPAAHAADSEPREFES